MKKVCCSRGRIVSLAILMATVHDYDKLEGVKVSTHSFEEVRDAYHIMKANHEENIPRQLMKRFNKTK